MGLWDEFVAKFGVWEEALPYLHLIVEEKEMRLVVAMQGRQVRAEDVVDLLGLSPESSTALLQRAYSRSVVNKVAAEAGAVYEAGTFYGRLDHFAKFERWEEIPLEDRQAIDRRFVNEFIARHRPAVEGKMQGCEAGHDLPNDTVLLLSEVETMLDAATDIAVQPCDCRRLGQNCDRPTETCISLDSVALQILDRGHGRRLSRAEAKELVRWVDRQGLMHTADSEWQARGLHAICNCCACDCYPFRAARELGSKGVWPRSRYVAAYDGRVCSQCGACVNRCHFSAFSHDGTEVEIKGKTRRNVRFDSDRCWGCGLCASTCPTGAIVMQSLEAAGKTRSQR